MVVTLKQAGKTGSENRLRGEETPRAQLGSSSFPADKFSKGSSQGGRSEFGCRIAKGQGVSLSPFPANSSLMVKVFAIADKGDGFVAEARDLQTEERGARWQISRGPCQMHFSTVTPPPITDLTISLLVFVGIKDPALVSCRRWARPERQQILSTPKAGKLEVLSTVLKVEARKRPGIEREVAMEDGRLKKGEPKWPFQPRGHVPMTLTKQFEAGGVQ